MQIDAQKIKVHATDPTDPFDRLKLGCIRFNIHIYIAQMLHPKKKQTQAYYGLKLIKKFITE